MLTKLHILAVIVLLGVFVVSLASMHINRQSATMTPEIQKRIKHVTQTAFAQAATGAQDRNPILSLIHFTNAKAYLNACQHISGGNLSALERQFGVNIETDLKPKLLKGLSKAIKTITTRCPKLAIKGAGQFAIGAGWVA